MKIPHYLILLFLISCVDSKETKRDRFFQQGNYALANQSYDEAVDFYTKSIENDTDFASAYNNRGVARIEDGHPYEAIQDYNQAIAINPNYYEAFFNRAYAYENVGKLKNALEDIDFLESVYPDSAYIYFYKGILQTGTREYEEGIHSFHQSIRLDTSNMESFVNLATLYFFNNQMDSSRYWLKYIMKRSPNEPNAYNTMSQIYLSENDHKNALLMINQALNIVPQEPYFLNNRGQVYLEMGEDEKAVKDINKSILLDPQNAWAYRNKAIYYLRKDQPNEAIKLLESALARNKFIDEVYSYLGEAYFTKQENQKACDFWKKGMELKEKRSIDFYSSRCN